MMKQNQDIQPIIRYGGDKENLLGVRSERGLSQNLERWIEQSFEQEMRQIYKLFQLYVSK